MLAVVGRRYDSQRAVRIEIEGERIARVSPAEDNSGLSYVAPGFCDLQINGYQGVEFNDPKLTVEQVRATALSQDQFGVTRFLATCTTDSYEVFTHSFATIAQACEELPEVVTRIAGIHMEGPYISPDDGPRGAHPRQHVRPPDWDEFCRLQEAARGKIKLLTLSPEYDGSAAFIAKVAASGVLVAIGHTKANSDQIRAAADAGARMSTHLGNGAHPQIKRHPNYIWDQLAEDRLTASLIADGHHLPPAVVKAMVRAKSLARCVLVSDLTSMGGMPPGRYKTGLGDLEILDSGKLVIAGQPDILAGASEPIQLCVANVMRFAQVDLQTAVEMASTTPLRLIGESDRGLEVGAVANLTLFDLLPDEHSPLKIKMTVNSGKIVYQSEQ